MYEIGDIFRFISPCDAPARAMEKRQGIFQALEEFVAAHRACGTLTGDADAPTPEGYRLRVSCSCGASFERWVTPEAAEYDLLWSPLLTSQN